MKMAFLCPKLVKSKIFVISVFFVVASVTLYGIVTSLETKHIDSSNTKAAATTTKKVSSTTHKPSENSCSLNTTRNELCPLLVHAETNEILYPLLGDRHLNIAIGESIKLICPGQNNSVDHQEIVVATCVKDNLLQVNGNTVEWDSITCDFSLETSVSDTGNKCQMIGDEKLIGLKTGEGYLRVAQVCFNNVTQQAYYVHNNITPVVNEGISGVKYANMRTDGMSIERSLKTLYSQANQRKVINQLLGLDQDSVDVIQNDAQHAISARRLVTSNDYFYWAERNCTYYYVNAAPIWISCASGNLLQVEGSIANYAENNNVTLQQWTGLYGVTTLPNNKTGMQQELYLFAESEPYKLPVPELIWKVLYEPTKQLGMAILLVNNPYIDRPEGICDDVSNDVTWITWSKDEKTRGFGYVCTVDSFRKIVTFLPEFSTQGLLV